MKKILLFLFAILVISIIIYFLYKVSKIKKEGFATTTTLKHATYYANWAQFWPNGPQDNTDNKNVNSPFAIQSSLGNVDTIIYGIVMFGIMPNPTLSCSYVPSAFVGTYSCMFNDSSISDGIKFFLQGCMGKEEGDIQEDVIETIFGEEASMMYDVIDNVASLVENILSGFSEGGDSPPLFVSDNNNFLTYPMYPNECFTGCGIDFDKFYWSTSGTGSKCCSLYRITDPYCFAQLRSLGKTLIASYGGWTYTHGGAEFSNISQNMFTSMISNSTTRGKFINTSGSTLQAWGFQGADFDWEYPGSASAGAIITTTLGYTSTTDFYNFECLIKEYRTKFPNFILSMQCSGFLSGDAHYSGPLDGYFQNGESVYMASDSDYFSWINRLFTVGLSRVNFMAYDYFVAGGQPYTMPNTPLYCPNQEANNFLPWPGTTSSFNPSYPWINPDLTISDYQNLTTQESFAYVSCGTVTAGSSVVNGFVMNSISNIASAYGVPPQSIVDATNTLQSSSLPQLTSSSQLQLGQILYIPCNNSSVPVCGTGKWPSGFGLAQVAENNNITVNAFENANPLYVQYASNVQVGNIYNIPCKDTSPQSGNVCPAYVLTQSTYSDLATSIGANVNDVVNLNPSSPPSSLVINQNVNVPCVNNVCPGVYYALPGDSLQSIFAKLFPKIDITSPTGKSLYNNYLQLNSSLQQTTQPNKLLSTNPQTAVRVPCSSSSSTTTLPPSVPSGTQLDFQGSNNSATVQYCILKSMVLMNQIFGKNIGNVHLGLAMYGRSYSNVNFLGMSGDDLIQNSVGLPSTGAMWGGSYTQTSGVLSYYEIQQLLQEKDANGNSLYISGYNKKYGINVALSLENNTWICYDDFSAIQEKLNYAKNLGFGGVMTFTPQQDDFSKGFPLMNYINSKL
jgi:GH18 family chitinase